MAGFYKKVTVFTTPIIVVISIMYLSTFIVGLKSGELITFDYSMLRQRFNTDGGLLGFAYNEQNTYYKIKNVNYYKADVIALGTSRVMQYKGLYFSDSFYNAGGGVNNNYDEYLNFLQNMNYKPKVAIIGLDLWVFNSNWNQQCPVYDSFRKIEKIDREWLVLFKKMYNDYCDGKWNEIDIDNFSDNYGFNGRVKSSGFMRDGSYYARDMYINPSAQKDYQFKDTLNRIDNGISRFEYGDQVDDTTIEKLTKLCDFCKNNNIYCIFFIPPVAPTVYSAMNESGNYKYIYDIDKKCRPIIEQNEFELYDFISVGEYGITDDYFIDGFHGGEVLYGWLLMNMADNGSIIKEYINYCEIENMMKNRYSNLLFYNPN